MIYQVEDYYDDSHRHVREFVVVKGDKPEEFVRYVGVGMIEIRLGNQSIPRQFNANLESETLEEAFGKFDDIMAEASKEVRKEIEKEMDQQRQEEMSKIVIPE